MPFTPTPLSQKVHHEPHSDSVCCTRRWSLDDHILPTQCAEAPSHRRQSRPSHRRICLGPPRCGTHRPHLDHVGYFGGYRRTDRTTFRFGDRLDHFKDLISTTHPPQPDRTTESSSSSGQAAIELALCLPVLVLLLLGAIHTGLMVQEQLHLELVTREVALAAARATDPSATAHAVTHHMLNHAATDLRLELLPGPITGTEMVQVQITITSRVAVPFISTIIAPRQLTARVTMAREPP